MTQHLKSGTLHPLTTSTDPISPKATPFCGIQEMSEKLLLAKKVYLESETAEKHEKTLKHVKAQPAHLLCNSKPNLSVLPELHNNSPDNSTGFLPLCISHPCDDHEKENDS